MPMATTLKVTCLRWSNTDFYPFRGDPRNPEWIEQGLDLWMTQVALVTHDIERLTDYYSAILGFNPYRAANISGRPTFDDATGIDDVELKVVFRMAQRSKSMEFWQYDKPQTPQLSGNRVKASALGYSYSIEVEDIHAEYSRMSDLGWSLLASRFYWVMLGKFMRMILTEMFSHYANGLIRIRLGRYLTWSSSFFLGL